MRPEQPSLPAWHGQSEVFIGHVDWSGAEVDKFHRAAKKPVTMRLDANLVDWLKSYGRGYQTRANQLLRHAMVGSRWQEAEVGVTASATTRPLLSCTVPE